MTASRFDPAALEKRLQRARQLYRLHAQGGGATVLDRFLSESGEDGPELHAWLREQAGVEVVGDPQALRPDFDRLDAMTARRLDLVVLRSRASDQLILAAADPWESQQIGEAMGRSGVSVVAAVSRPQLTAWLDGQQAQRADGGKPMDDATNADGLVVRFVDMAIQTGYATGASDIHFECSRNSVVVKFRLDGVMSAWRSLEGKEHAEACISRIKVMAQLDITERRVPQDGRFRAALGDGAGLDLRVSIMPSVHGEDAVLRLLDKAQLRSGGSVVTLDTLGFDAQSRDRIRELATRPHGMLLVTGPTGSGKTTTVYAVLSEVNSGVEKIITIEDPVEYELQGVLQIPVNERKGLTFAKGLRSILRHDPDRILVGEIRDAETAEIAVQSSLTGHQVLTTVHANSIFDVTGRFRHFGLDMFGFMAALNGVVVQRLVRKVCPHCIAQRQPLQHEADWLARHGCVIKFCPVAVGCSECRGTGYSGRAVLAEVHVLDDEFRDLVIRNAPVSELRQQVLHAPGHVPLGTAAAQLVLQGMTTLEEVKRVVGW